MDDTWVIQQQSHKQAFLDHINSIDPAIKFIVEGNQGNGAILFLDTLVTPQADNSLAITVYCKATHTDQYLQWDSHHNLSTKYSVIGTLTQMAKTVCTRPQLSQKEIQHHMEALAKCNYPNLTINKVQSKYTNSNQEDNNNNNNLQDNNSNHSGDMDQANQGRDNSITSQNTCNPYTSIEEAPTRQKSNARIVVIPCTKGIAESFKKICGKYGMQTYFKCNTTIKQVLMKPNDQDPKDKKSGVIYIYQCRDIVCGEKYIGETSGTQGERYKAHLKQPSSICAHPINRTQLHSQQFQQYWEGGPGLGQDHKRSYLHKGKQSNIK